MDRPTRAWQPFPPQRGMRVFSAGSRTRRGCAVPAPALSSGSVMEGTAVPSILPPIPRQAISAAPEAATGGPAPAGVLHTAGRARTRGNAGPYRVRAFRPLFRPCAAGREPAPKMGPEETPAAAAQRCLLPEGSFPIPTPIRRRDALRGRHTICPAPHPAFGPSAAGHALKHPEF